MRYGHGKGGAHPTYVRTIADPESYHESGWGEGVASYHGYTLQYQRPHLLVSQVSVTFSVTDSPSTLD